MKKFRDFTEINLKKIILTVSKFDVKMKRNCEKNKRGGEMRSFEKNYRGAVRM